jgi:hypothetical protein
MIWLSLLAAAAHTHTRTRARKKHAPLQRALSALLSSPHMRAPAALSS